MNTSLREGGVEEEEEKGRECDQEEGVRGGESESIYYHKGEKKRSGFPP